MLAAALLGMGAMSNAVPIYAVDGGNPSRRNFEGYATTPHRIYGSKGAGISMAQQKRASRKRKNVMRHRARG